jgi:hypothetical protein
MTLTVAQIDGVTGLRAFCDDFESIADTSTPHGDGLVPFLGIDDATSAYLQALDRFTTGAISIQTPQQRKNRQGQGQSTQLSKRDATTNTNGDGTADGQDSSDSTSDNSTDTSQDVDPSTLQLDSDNTVTSSVQFFSDSLAWEYQFCTQFGEVAPFVPIPFAYICSGFFVVNNPAKNDNLLSQFISHDAIQTECTRLFGTYDVQIPQQPQIADVLKYGGWDMKPTQTFFTHGERTFTISCQQRTPHT